MPAWVRTRPPVVVVRVINLLEGPVLDRAADCDGSHDGEAQTGSQFDADGVGPAGTSRKAPGDSNPPTRGL